MPNQHETPSRIEPCLLDEITLSTADRATDLACKAMLLEKKVHNVMINLQTLTYIGSFARNLRDEVMTWVVENHNELIEEWKKWHT